MKTLLFGLAIISSFIITSSCKKNKNDEITLKGKWNVVSIIYHEVYLGENYDDNYIGKSGDYVDFKSGNVLHVHIDGDDDTDTYEILTNDRLVIGEDTLQIQSLTSSTVRLYQKVIVNATDYSENTINLKR